MTEASIEELKKLASLVRCGRLYDVQAWLAAGKPFEPPIAEARYQHGTPQYTNGRNFVPKRDLTR
jgi:hypothetical protein